MDQRDDEESKDELNGNGRWQVTTSSAFPTNNNNSSISALHDDQPLLLDALPCTNDYDSSHACPFC
jgi:hypothetical protein